MLQTKFNGDAISVWHKTFDPKIVEILKQDIARLVDIGEDSGVSMDKESRSFKVELNAPKHSYPN